MVNIISDNELGAIKIEDILCPKGRLSRPTKLLEGRDIVDISSFAPYFLSAVNNALSRGASKHYLKKFGVGIVEWRVVSMLAIEPKIRASRICEAIYLDKSGTSRALKHLLAMGFLSFKAAKSDPRRKIWWLNKKGYGLHDEILLIALKREEKLIEGVKPEELETMLKVFRKMLKNVDQLDAC